MSKWDKEYYELTKKILEDGTRVKNRTVIDTIKLPYYNFVLNKEITDFFDFDNSKELKDVKILNYKHHGKLLMDVAV